jgi:hypothetical protein
MGSLAAASALATAIVSAPAVASPADPTVLSTGLEPAATPLVRHVVKYVQLKPGETAPPQAVVRQQAAPKPRVVTLVTRQSGSRP